MANVEDLELAAEDDLDGQLKEDINEHTRRLPQKKALVVIGELLKRHMKGPRSWKLKAFQESNLTNLIRRKV